MEKNRPLGCSTDKKVHLYKIESGTKIKAVVPAKYKTTYSFGPVFQTDDIYGETKLLKEEQVVEGVVFVRPLIKNGKKHPTKTVKCMQTNDRKRYRLDKLRNIQIL